MAHSTKGNILLKYLIQDEEFWEYVKTIVAKFEWLVVLLGFFMDSVDEYFKIEVLKVFREVCSGLMTCKTSIMPLQPYH